jgi:hypothetical protein
MDGSRAAGAAVGAVVVAPPAIVGLGLAHPHARPRAAWRDAWTQTAPSNTRPATLRTVPLPDRLRSLTADGTVSVWRTRDGRAYLIAKTALGYKGNWRGVVYGPSPLREGELRADDGYGRAGIVFDEGSALFEATLAKRRGGGLYEVFFDLN